MLIAYNSKVNGIGTLKTLFPHIIPSGLTPEGVCFDAVMTEILNDAKGKDSYFINFSDGQPNVHANGKSGNKITQEAVNKIKSNGVKVLSFFI